MWTPTFQIWKLLHIKLTFNCSSMFISVIIEKYEYLKVYNNVGIDLLYHKGSMYISFFYPTKAVNRRHSHPLDSSD